jgi:hypothetical protein
MYTDRSGMSEAAVVNIPAIVMLDPLLEFAASGTGLREVASRTLLRFTPIVPEFAHLFAAPGAARDALATAFLCVLPDPPVRMGFEDCDESTLEIRESHLQHLAFIGVLEVTD